MLNFYRKAIDLRKELCTDEEFAFIDSPKNTIAFKRSNSWTVITNFGPSPVDLPVGQLLISSAPLVSGKLPADATAWLK
jgi:alpha-glucosidase